MALSILGGILILVSQPLSKIIFLLIFLVVLVLFLTIFTVLKLTTIMNKQERLDAANEETNKAITGLRQDFQTFYKEYQEGTVSEASVAAAEANAAALTALDAEKEAPATDAPETEA